MGATLVFYDRWTVILDRQGRRFLNASAPDGSFTASRADSNDRLDAELDAALIAAGDADDSAVPSDELAPSDLARFEVSRFADGTVRVAAFRPRVRPMVALLDGHDRDRVVQALEDAVDAEFDPSATYDDWSLCNGCGDVLVPGADYCRRGYCRRQD